MIGRSSSISAADITIVVPPVLVFFAASFHFFKLEWLIPAAGSLSRPLERPHVSEDTRTLLK